MLSLLFAILGITILVSGIEFIFWHIYSRKNVGLRFPHATDESFFRFFTHERLKLLTFGHTLFLILIFSILAFLVW